MRWEPSIKKGYYLGLPGVKTRILIEKVIHGNRLWVGGSRFIKRSFRDTISWDASP